MQRTRRQLKKELQEILEATKWTQDPNLVGPNGDALNDERVRQYRWWNTVTSAILARLEPVIIVQSPDSLGPAELLSWKKKLEDEVRKWMDSPAEICVGHGPVAIELVGEEREIDMKGEDQ